LAFRKEPKRVYPRENLASHFVGFTNVDMVGVAGAERAFNADLTSENAPSFALSLDLRVQFALADELAVARDPDTTLPETLFNHAAMSTYDLGSVFKPLTMAMALEDGVADKQELFQVQKPFCLAWIMSLRKVPSRKFRNVGAK